MRVLRMQLTDSKLEYNIKPFDISGYDPDSGVFEPDFKLESNITLTHLYTSLVPAVTALPSRRISSTTRAADGQKVAPPPSQTYVDPPLTGR